MAARFTGNRFLMRRMVYWQRQNDRFVDRTLVVGANPEGLAVAEQLRMHCDESFNAIVRQDFQKVNDRVIRQLLESTPGTAARR